MKNLCFSLFFLLVLMPLTCYSASTKKQKSTEDASKPTENELAHSKAPAFVSDAPFGLKWQMTKNELIKIGVMLNKKDSKSSATRYSAKNLPKNMNDTDDVSMIIDDEFGLVKITWISKNITNDAFGTQGKSKYDELKEGLTKKYNMAGNSFERVGMTLFKESDEFYQCLKYSGCGMYSTSWKSEAVDILLELKGLSRGVGYLTIVYEHKKWNDVVDKIKNNNSEAL